MMILLLTAFVALSMADVSQQEYTFENPVPQTSYGVPQGSVAGSSAQLTLPSVWESLNFNSGSTEASGYDSASDVTSNSVPSVSFVEYSQSSDSAKNIIPGQAGLAGLGNPNTGSEFNFGGNTYEGNTSEDSVDDSSAATTGATSSAEEYKHLYFFSAPEEEDEVIEAKYYLPLPAKKSYKILFIKAPIYKNQGTITLPAPPQIDEKTLVYVLVRKHNGQAKVHFKEAVPTVSSKPEVFFIRYKTQKEAEAAVANIQSLHGASGQVIANLPVGTQAAFQSREGSIEHNSSSKGIESISKLEGSVSGASAYSGGFSLDSLGANSFVTANVANRISNQTKQQHSGEDSAQHGGEDDVQNIVDQGLISQTPTPVTFGQNSINSLLVFGGAKPLADVPGTQPESSETTASIIAEYITTEIASASNYMENVEP